MGRRVGRAKSSWQESLVDYNRRLLGHGTTLRQPLKGRATSLTTAVRRLRSSARRRPSGVPRITATAHARRMIISMNRGRSMGLTLTVVVAIAATVDVTLASRGRQAPWVGVLEEHPAIQYASRPTTDRVARLNQSLAQHSLSRQSAEGAAADRTFQRDERTGHLMSVLDALGVPVESQLLVFSKTGVQRAYTSPHNPRALFYNESVVVGYVPGAPLIEIASLDPQQAVIFYTVDQAAAAPTFVRGSELSELSCLVEHIGRAGIDRAQQHRRGRRDTAAATGQQRREPPDASPGSMGRLVTSPPRGRRRRTRSGRTAATSRSRRVATHRIRCSPTG